MNLPLNYKFLIFDGFFREISKPLRRTYLTQVGQEAEKGTKSRVLEFRDGFIRENFIRMSNKRK